MLSSEHHQPLPISNGTLTASQSLRTQMTHAIDPSSHQFSEADICS